MKVLKYLYMSSTDLLIKSYSWTKNAPVEMVKPLRLMAFIRSPFISLHLKAGSSSGLFQPSWPSSLATEKKENTFQLWRILSDWLVNMVDIEMFFQFLIFIPPQKKATSLRQMCKLALQPPAASNRNTTGTSTKTFQHVGSIFQKCSRYQDISIDIRAIIM